MENNKVEIIDDIQRTEVLVTEGTLQENEEHISKDHAEYHGLNYNIIKTFNTFYISLLRDLKNMKENFRTIIKKHYKTIDKNSEEYMNFIKNSLNKEDILTNNYSGKFIGKDLIISDILEIINENDKIIFLNYIYILYIIIIIDDEEEGDDKDNLFKQTINIISNIQKKQDVKEDINFILHDDIKELLDLISHIKENEKFNTESIENTTIGSLAKEIADEIDVSQIQNLDNPQEIFKSMMNFDGENNILGNIIKTVSSKVNEKITSGELNQAQLFKEAMGMLETGDIFNSFFNMQKPKSVPKNKNRSLKKRS